MIFIFNANGDLLNSELENVYQGSNGANTIYVLAPFSSTCSVTAQFTLPNGKVTGETLLAYSKDLSQVTDENKQPYSVWVTTLNEVVTAYSGKLTAQFSIVNATQVVKTMSVTIPVLKGVAPTLPLDTSNNKTIQEILGLVTTILERTPELNISNGEGSGSIEQKSFEDDTKNPKATGLGSVALGGFRGDKPNNQPDDSDTTTTAEGIQSVAFGAGCHAYGNWSLAGGKDNKAYGRQTVALGGACVAGRENAPANEFLASFAMGDSVKSSGRCSFAAGQQLNVSGKNSSSFGYQNVIQGTESFAIGQSNKISKQYNFAAGYNNRIGTNVDGSIINNYDSYHFAGNWSAAIGFNNVISHDRSYLIGHDLVDIAPSVAASSDKYMPQIVVGRWNSRSENDRNNNIFVVGAGYGEDKYQDGSYKYEEWLRYFNPFVVHSFGATVRGGLRIEQGIGSYEANHIRVFTGVKGKDEQVEVITIEPQNPSIKLNGDNAFIKINGKKVVTETEIEALRAEIKALKTELNELKSKL